MPTDPTPGPHRPEYRYRLELETLDQQVARFVYADAPAPHADDTALDLNRAVWEAMRRPGSLWVDIAEDVTGE